MSLVSLCNFSVRFGKYLFEKFAKFFSVLVQTLVGVALTATTAADKIGGEAAL